MVREVKQVWQISHFPNNFAIDLPEPTERFLGDSSEGEQPLLLDETAP